MIPIAFVLVLLSALATELIGIHAVFGAFLLATGVKMLFWSAAPPDIGGHPLLRWLKSRLHVTEQLHGERFVVRRRDAGGRAGAVGLCSDPDDRVVRILVGLPATAGAKRLASRHVSTSHDARIS